MAKIEKSRYWWAVLWLENLPKDWEETLADIVQVPFAYCIHDKDKDEIKEDRKKHAHVLLAFPNTTTYKHAMSVFKLLGEKALNTCEAVINVRHAYEYLIHNTEGCRKKHKHAYAPEERITGNNFDIGLFEQISTAEKQEMLKELIGYIMANGYITINDFTDAALKEYDSAAYWEVIVGYNGTLERYCRGNYLKIKARREAEQAQSATHQAHEAHEAHEKTCPNCGSVEIKKKGKTASDQQRYQCKECGKTFV